MASNIVQYILDISTGKATKGLKQATKATDDLNKELTDQAKDGKKASDSMKGLGQSTETMANKQKSAAGGLALSANAMLDLGAKALGAAKSFVDFAQKQADLINDLNDLSTRSGVTSESILALQFAFKASGQEADKVKGLLDKLPRVLAMADRGTGTVSIAFDRLGLSLRDVDGQMKSTNQIFGEMVTAIQAIPNATEKATTASEIFGTQAGNMLQAFGNVENMATFMEFTNRFGVDIEKASSQSAKFQQAMAGLDVAMGKLGQSIASIFGEGGFVGPIKLAGQVISGFAALVDGVVATSTRQFDGFVLDLKQRLLEFLQVVYTALDALASFSLSSEAMSFTKNALREIGQGLDDIAEKQKEASISRLTTRTDLHPIHAATKAFKDYGREIDNVMAKLGGGGGPSGGASPLAPRADDETPKDMVVKLPNLEKSIDDLAKLQGDFVDLEADMIALMENLPAELGGAMLSAGASAISAMQTPQGIISGIGGTMGPLGAGGAEIINAISALGEKSPEEIEAEMAAFLEAFAKGLAMLPGILIRVLPPLLLQVSTTIVKELVKLPIRFGEAIVLAIKDLWNTIKEFFSGGAGQERREARRERRSEALQSVKDFWGDVIGKQGGGRFVPSAQNGMRYTGSSRGLALLHEGETVVPRSGQASQQTQRDMVAAGGGGGLTVNINASVVEGNAVDGLVRQIEQRFRQFGNSRSPLFNS